MSSSNLRIKAELSAIKSLITKRSRVRRARRAEFGEKVSFDLIKQLCGIDQQDQPSIGFEIDHPRDQPHLFGRQFGRGADCIGCTFMISETLSTRKPAITPPIANMRMRRDPACSVVLKSNRRRRSTIGTTLPRKFITPSMNAGAFGNRVMCSGGRAISLTAAMGIP